MGKKKVEEFVPPSLPNYADLEHIEPSKLSLNADFIKVCKEMAG
jgi:hypothetical protein